MLWLFRHPGKSWERNHHLTQHLQFGIHNWSSSFVPVPFPFDVAVTEKRIVELKKMAMEILKSRLRAIVYPPGTTPIDWRLFSILFLSMVRRPPVYFTTFQFFFSSIVWLLSQK